MNLYRVGRPYGTLMVVVKVSFADRESERDLDHLSKSPVTITDWAVAEGLEKPSEREGDNVFRSIPLNDELV